MGLNVKLDAVDTTSALVRFIRDHVDDAGREGVVLGLSSGLDSAVTAALAVRALGPEKVHAVFMPSASTPENDQKEAESLAATLGITLETRGVDPIVEGVLGVLGQQDRFTIANATARARMIVLYALARERRALVLGTSNKSEMLVGYFTKHGDGGSDLAPIGDLYKTQVRLLAQHLGLPELVVRKPPSAGLWAGQSDEDELGITYEMLDPILLGFELGMEKHEIVARTGSDEITVDRVERMLRLSEHKRLMPRVCKIGIRSLTSDWRRGVNEGGPTEA